MLDVSQVEIKALTAMFISMMSHKRQRKLSFRLRVEKRIQASLYPLEMEKALEDILKTKPEKTSKQKEKM